MKQKGIKNLIEDILGIAVIVIIAVIILGLLSITIYSKIKSRIENNANLVIIIENRNNVYTNEKFIGLIDSDMAFSKRVSREKHRKYWRGYPLFLKLSEGVHNIEVRSEHGKTTTLTLTVGGEKEYIWYRFSGEDVPIVELTLDYVPLSID